MVQRRDDRLKPVASLSAEAFQRHPPSSPLLNDTLNSTYADSCMISNLVGLERQRRVADHIFLCWRDITIVDMGMGDEI